jgi:hypothetical protein
MVVVKKGRLWWGLLASECVESRAVDEIDVQPSVIIEVQKGNSRTD